MTTPPEHYLFPKPLLESREFTQPTLDIAALVFVTFLISTVAVLFGAAVFLLSLLIVL